MDTYNVVYIDRNFIDSRYPNKPEDGSSFFTHGFGSLYAREFKKYNPHLHVECWKADPRINKIIEKEIQGVRYRMFPSLSLGKIGQYSWKLKKFLKNWISAKPQTVFNISSFDHLLFYSVAPLLRNNPLVVQNHGEGTAIYKASINRGFKRVYYNFLTLLEKKGIINIDVLYVLDEGLKTWLPDNLMPPEVKVRTTGVDLSLFYPVEKTQAKKDLGLNPSKKVLMYVGRLNDTKRPDILLNIYQELKLERDDVELILAGHEKTDPLYQKAVNSGAILYGVIPQEKMYAYLSAADIYLLPGLNANHSFGGIGMLPVQAMLCNTPVIGGTIINFPSNDRANVGIAASDQKSIKAAILTILDKTCLFNEIREYALNYYSWEKISQNTVLDYNRLIQKPDDAV